MPYQIEYAFTCHIGRMRNNNEDNFWCCGESLEADNQGMSRVQHRTALLSDFPVLAVFDGMGGESCGEMASYLGAQTCGKYYAENKDLLRNGAEQFLDGLCSEMNRAVCTYSSENRIHSMGSTAAILAFGPDFVCSSNLGDSRIYCMQDGTLRRLSADHVLGGGLFGKSPLTQYLGINEEDMILEPSGSREIPSPGLRFLVCSDGLTDMLKDQEIASVLVEKIPVEEAAGELLEQALRRGGRDNITIIVSEITEREEGWFSKIRNWFLKKHV